MAGIDDLKTQRRTLKAKVTSASNRLRGQYTIAKVKKVFPGKYGHVRTVSLIYKNFRIGEKLRDYHGSCSRVIIRSVQKLALLVQVRE